MLFISNYIDTEHDLTYLSHFLCKLEMYLMHTHVIYLQTVFKRWICLRVWKVKQMCFKPAALLKDSALALLKNVSRIHQKSKKNDPISYLGPDLLRN